MTGGRRGERARQNGRMSTPTTQTSTTPMASTRSATADAGMGGVCPTRAEFHPLAADRRVLPAVRTVLGDGETPGGVYRKLAGERSGTFLFESAENGRS